MVTLTLIRDRVLPLRTIQKVRMTALVCGVISPSATKERMWWEGWCRPCRFQRSRGGKTDGKRRLLLKVSSHNSMPGSTKSLRNSSTSRAGDRKRLNLLSKVILRRGFLYYNQGTWHFARDGVTRSLPRVSSKTRLTWAMASG